MLSIVAWLAPPYLLPGRRQLSIKPAECTRLFKKNRRPGKLCLHPWRDAEMGYKKKGEKLGCRLPVLTLPFWARHLDTWASSLQCNKWKASHSHFQILLNASYIAELRYGHFNRFPRKKVFATSQNPTIWEVRSGHISLQTYCSTKRDSCDKSYYILGNARNISEDLLAQRLPSIQLQYNRRNLRWIICRI